MESVLPYQPFSSSTNFAAIHDDLSSNPLYLHHGDNPALHMVIQPLNGENYNARSRSMIMMALTAKNKLVFIDGSLPQPPAIDPTFRSWKRCNNMVLSWIMNSVTKDIYISILYISNAEVMWKDLKDCFSQSNCARVFVLKKSISALIQGNNFVNAYYIALKGLWDELVNFK